MIRRKMLKSNTQKKGGKRNLVKKATSGLLMTSLASGVVMNANVLEVYANTAVVQQAKEEPVFVETKDVNVAGTNIHNALDKFFEYDPSLKYSQYRKVFTVDLNQDKSIENTTGTIARALKYHGSKEFYTTVIETNESAKTLKLMLSFNPDTVTDVDKDGYADKLNLVDYTEAEMKALENRYVGVLQTIGYNVVNYVDHETEVNNVIFRRNLDNGKKQSEYDLIMKVMDEYIASNKGAEKKQFALKVWKEGKTHVCIKIYVSNVEGEQAVDSEQADLLKKIEVLRGNYEKRKVEEVAPVVEETVQPEVVEETQTEESVVTEVVDSNGQATDVEVDQEGFIRTTTGGALVIDLDGGSEEQREMNSYGDAVNSELVRLINEVRTNNGLPVLQSDDTALIYAGEKSLDMMGTGSISLTNSDGKTPIDYLRDAMPNLKKGYHAVGQCVKLDDPNSTAKNLFDQFIAIPGMEEKVLDPEVTHIAVSVAFKDYSIFVSELLTGY